eukprot:574034-Rhodomonas_salina.1
MLMMGREDGGATQPGKTKREKREGSVTGWCAAGLLKVQAEDKKPENQVHSQAATQREGFIGAE